MEARVALIDDHPVLIHGLKDILESSGQVHVMGTYGSAAEFLKGCEHPAQRPDIALIDILMPGMDGEELSGIIQKRYPDMRMIAFTNVEQRYFLRSMMQNGVSGYVLKSSSEQVLLEAIAAVSAGQIYFDPIIREAGVQALKANTKVVTPPIVLTNREREILLLIMENYNSYEIAERLYISKRTVDFHRANLLLKLNVKSSATLVKKAIDLGLVK